MSAAGRIVARLAALIAPPGAAVASVPLLFVALVLIAVVQIPAHLAMTAGHLSAGVAMNELLAIAGVPLVLIWRLRLDGRLLLPHARPGVKLVAAVVIATAGAVVVIDYATVVSELVIPVPDRVEQGYRTLMASQGAAGVALKIIVLCLLPAVCEEIFFRGFCLVSLARRFGAPAGIAGSALLFAALHANVWYLHLYFLLGILLGVIFWRSGTLWAPILAHFINNAWTYLNHVRGFRLPLGTEPNAVDAVVVVAGLLLLGGGLDLIGRCARGASAAATSPTPGR